MVLEGIPDASSMKPEIRKRQGTHPLPSTVSAEATVAVVEGQSTEVCPYCLGNRKRIHGRSRPMTREECENQQRDLDLRIFGKPMPFRSPRVDWFPVRNNAPYFFCWEKAVCSNPVCIQRCVDTQLIRRNCYYRQFNDMRLLLLWTHDFIVGNTVPIKDFFISQR